jgi:hypothetical protein
MKQKFREVKTEIIENELTDKLMSKEEFMEDHGSGTLRKNARLGFLHRDQYREERIAWELGYQFELLPASRVMIGIPITEGNCHPVERFLHHKNKDDENFIPAYIRTEYSDGTVNEGIDFF